MSSCTYSTPAIRWEQYNLSCFYRVARKRLRVTENLIDFEWSVHRTGYSWSVRLPLWGGDEPPPPGPYLVSGDLFALGGYADTNEYRPLDDRRALFRIFARTPTTPADILSFANGYGRLGIEKARVPTTDDYAPGSMHFTYGESYSQWVTHIETMRAVLKLWQVVKSEERWEPEKVLMIAKRLVAVSDDRFVGIVVEGMAGTKPSRPDAEGALFSTINALLRQHAKMTVAFDQLHILKRNDDRGSDDGTIDQPGFTPRLRIAPSSLLGALWFQLARAVAGNIEFKECRQRQCETWFEVDHSSTRSSREFCSESCRSRAYRDRTASAQRLHASGMTTPAIADALGSTEATVVKWINKASTR